MKKKENSEDGISDNLFQNINHIIITACGTAMYLIAFRLAYVKKISI